MNRREMLERFTASLAAAGLVVKTDEVRAESPKDALAVIHCDGWITQEHAARIKQLWEAATEGTNLEGMKCLVLDKDLRLSIERR